MFDKVLQTLRSMDINFNKLCEDNYSDLEEDLRLAFEDECSISCDSGVSKMVIFIQGADRVLKIPYSCCFDREVYEYDLAQWDSGDFEDMEEPLEECYWWKFECANCANIEAEYNWDYCALECAIYEAAYKRGLAPYFAKEEFYGLVNDRPVYTQVRVKPFEVCSSTISKQQKEDTRRKCDSCGVRCFNSVWVTDFINHYGMDEFIKLSNFLTELGIIDLHEGNLGYYQGAPILLDYSDFREW